ncbi:hypothetical protein [Streptomyces sp. I05A-00742]|uniref:hypothetical protein n=1 Tax=Streptomyces sp. I05A-00742 TaxID=2732853 RepID=UPI00148A0180|nr:hypothetical protein [Streptomyces sp. I05A-00742]
MTDTLAAALRELPTRLEDGDEPPVPAPDAEAECERDLGEAAASEFSHRFQTINIWGNKGFLNVSDIVRGGQHADTAGDTEPSGASVRGDGVELREGDISAERTALALEGFAEPPWFDEALARLRDRVVFLVGREGTGRRTAALNLLSRHTGGSGLRALGSPPSSAVRPAYRTP